MAPLALLRSTNINLCCCAIRNRSRFPPPIAGGPHGLGDAAALQPPRPRHVAPQRYASAGPIHAFAGGGFDPADAAAELEAFRRPQLARVGTGLAAYDRAAGNTPWAERA